jgi:hypothetical protein
MKKLFLIFIILCLFGLGVAGYLAYQEYGSKLLLMLPESLGGVSTSGDGSTDSEPSGEKLVGEGVPGTAPGGDVSTEGWKTYIDTELGLEFMYPDYLEELVSGERSPFSVRDVTEIVDDYAQYADEGCPSTCGRFTSDPDLLDRQFTMLDQLPSGDSCELDPALEESVRKEFILLTGGSGNKHVVSSVANGDGDCVLKFIEEDGFAVDLDNYFYKVGFKKGDKVIDARFRVFDRAFPEAKVVWDSFGYSEDGSCDADCFNEMMEYYKTVDLNAAPAKGAIEVYDALVGSLKVL